MFWKAKFPINSLNYNEKFFDVIIIGAGITGLSTAYYLKDSGLKVAILDQGKVGSGITCKTTAKITFLQGDIYQKLGSRAKEYYQSQKDAIWEILQIIEKEDISCELEQVPSILFSLEEKNNYKIELEKKILESFDERPFIVENDKIQSGIGISNSYVFHPLKFLSGLSLSISMTVPIFENTLVTEIRKENSNYILSTSRGVFHARDVVIACHYPFFLLPNLFPVRTYVQREYVNAAKVLDIGKYSAINVDEDLHSIRYYQDYVLYGSNRHRLTSQIDFGKHYEKSRKEFKQYFGKIPSYTWDNQDIVSHDLLPMIGRVEQHLFIGTAYRGWGMTNGVLAGKMIANLVLHKSCSYVSLFDPKRINFSMFSNSFIGLFHYMKAYTDSFFQKNNPSYVRIHGVAHAIYEDEEYEIHKVCLVCPHMKCQLVFNSYDKTWDCPCHGSRFLLDGTLLKGPATKSLSKK